MKKNQAITSQQIILENPAGWPQEVLPIFERATTCEFTTLTRKGTPITFPLTPYIGERGDTLDVSTGLTYPAKAERARRNPKVGMLFSDPVGTELVNPPVVLVTGLATVKDTDLQANTDRYVRLSLEKLPAAFKGMPPFILRRLQFYFVRIWIAVTPLHMLWWPEGQLDEPPRRWDAPEGINPPPSDPAPSGQQPAAWKESAADWLSIAIYALKTLGLPILTLVDPDGFPRSLRVKEVALNSEGFRLELPTGLSVQDRSPACLLFHTHPEEFTGQENKLFVGEVIPASGVVFFRVDRPVADWSLGGFPGAKMLSFLSAAKKLAPRLRAEVARRGQPIPQIHLPTDKKR